MLETVVGGVYLGVERVVEIAVGGDEVAVALEVAGRDGGRGFGQGDGLPAGISTGRDEAERVGGVAAGEETCDEAGYSEGGYFYDAADDAAGLAGGHLRELQRDGIGYRSRINTARSRKNSNQEEG